MILVGEYHLYTLGNNTKYKTFPPSYDIFCRIVNQSLVIMLNCNIPDNMTDASCMQLLPLTEDFQWEIEHCHPISLILHLLKWLLVLTPLLIAI